MRIAGKTIPANGKFFNQFTIISFNNATTSQSTRKDKKYRFFISTF
jgi:hypothetical protein